MALPEPQARPTLPVSAKLGVGVLAVIGLITVVRWVMNGVFTLLLVALVVGALYAVAKVASRRLPD